MTEKATATSKDKGIPHCRELGRAGEPWFRFGETAEPKPLCLKGREPFWDPGLLQGPENHIFCVPKSCKPWLLNRDSTGAAKNSARGLYPPLAAPAVRWVPSIGSFNLLPVNHRSVPLRQPVILELGIPDHHRVKPGVPFGQAHGCHQLGRGQHRRPEQSGPAGTHTQRQGGQFQIRQGDAHVHQAVGVCLGSAETARPEPRTGPGLFRSSDSLQWPPRPHSRRRGGRRQRSVHRSGSWLHRPLQPEENFCQLPGL